MSEYLKCNCPNCGQSIEYPEEGIGQTVPCPTCQVAFALAIEISRLSDRPKDQTKEKPMAKKASRARLSNLNEETIRQKTQKGETPLHRAAKTGRIAEIPRHLLKLELFMERNKSFSRETPLHLAAQYGHLDKVPREFLTRETLTASTEYERKESKTGPTPPRTETPLHYAARFGHGDQIPKEFLTPEFLRIEASGYRLTVLHSLAYSKMLDLVPAIYASSEVWNLRNSQGQTPREVFANVLDQEDYVTRMRSEPATEKQKEKLRYFAIRVRRSDHEGRGKRRAG